MVAGPPMTAIEAYDAIIGVAIASARNVLPRHLAGEHTLHTDPDFLQSIRLRAWRAALHAVKQGKTDDLVPYGCVIGRNAGHDYLASLRPLGYRDTTNRAPRTISGGGLGNLTVLTPPDPDPFEVDDLVTRLERADLTTAELVSVLLGFARDWTRREIANLFGVTPASSQWTRVSALAKVRKAIA